jgi:hypothetical protein
MEHDDHLVMTGWLYNFKVLFNLGADYMESFQPGLSFIPVSRAEISARPKDKVLLKHSKRLHDQNSSPG